MDAAHEQAANDACDKGCGKNCENASSRPRLAALLVATVAFDAHRLRSQGARGTVQSPALPPTVNTKPD